jgi:hypothetical protein
MNTADPYKTLSADKQITDGCFLSYKPQASNASNKKMTLSPELIPLRQVIVLQHNNVAPHIQELGNICLNFTNIIEKEKKLFQNLTRKQNPKKTPCQI